MLHGCLGIGSIGALALLYRTCRPSLPSEPLEDLPETAAARAAPAACPGCGLRVADLRRHMKRCCPEKVAAAAPGEKASAHQAARKAASEQDWISEEEVKEAALQSFSRVKDPLLRRVLELRFGADQGGLRRSPAEVADALGGKYRGKAQMALMLIRQALRSIPLVADDPKDLVVIYEDDQLVLLSQWLTF